MSASCGATSLESKWILLAKSGRFWHFNSDNFDHEPVGFVGSASVTCAYTNGRPILYRPARHPDLGQRLEARDQRRLPEGDQRRRAGQRDELPGLLSRPRPHVQGPAGPSPDAHDVRLPGTTSGRWQLDGGPLRRARQGDGRRADSGERPGRTPSPRPRRRPRRLCPPLAGACRRSRWPRC